MASKSKIAKANRTPKFSTRRENRCKLCGDPRAVYRKFGDLPYLFPQVADQGLIPGFVRLAGKVVGESQNHHDD